MAKAMLRKKPNGVCHMVGAAREIFVSDDRVGDVVLDHQITRSNDQKRR